MVSCLAGLIQLLAERMLEAGAPVMDDFSDDSDRNLLRRHRTDIQADRRVDAFEPLAGNTFTGELLGNGSNFPFAADHSDISCVGLNGPAQYILIFLVAARYDDHVRVFVGNDFAEGLLKTLGEDRFGF